MIEDVLATGFFFEKKNIIHQIDILNISLRLFIVYNDK